MFIILKWWSQFPQLKQPALQTKFTSRKEAELILMQLKKDFPDRCFAIKEIK